MRLGWYPKIQCFDDDGNPLWGGTLDFFNPNEPTHKEIYITWNPPADPIPQANPVILDARGEATVYLDGEYKVVLKDREGVEVWTQDYVPGVVDLITIQTVHGEKTFTDLPKLPSVPTDDEHATNKLYVDTAASGGISNIQNNVYIYADDESIWPPNNAYKISLDPAVVAYVAGQLFYFKVGGGHTNIGTGQSTLAINNLPPILIRKMVEGESPGESIQDLAPGDIRGDDICAVIFTGTVFLLFNPTRKRIMIPHTWAIPGAITEDMFVVPFFVPVPSGQSAKLVAIRHQLHTVSGSALITVIKNGLIVTDWENIYVSNVATTTVSTSLELINSDKLGLSVEHVSYTITHLSFSLWIEYAI